MKRSGDEGQPVTVRILFVCLGNICRSPMAQGVMAGLLAGRDAGVDSAGTGAWHVGEPPDRRAQAAALAQGVDLSGQRARQVCAADFERFDHIIAMDRANLAELRRLAPKGGAARARLAVLLAFDPLATGSDVPDPYYEGGFDAVFAMIARACGGLRDHLDT